MARQSLEPTVGVFGSGDPCEGELEYRVACDVGRRLAELGYVVVNGGYGGTMEASARGAKDAGGEVIGVTCSVWRSPPNRFLSREIRTASLSERMEVLITEGANGYVCLPGATGTLAELAYVWEYLCKGLLPPRPLVCFGSFWRPVIDLMISARARSGDAVVVVSDVEGLERHFPPVLRSPPLAAPSGGPTIDP
jgi:uncharacterized protein (TIGR00725 family)